MFLTDYDIVQRNVFLTQRPSYDNQVGLVCRREPFGSGRRRTLGRRPPRHHQRGFLQAEPTLHEPSAVGRVCRASRRVPTRPQLSCRLRLLSTIAIWSTSCRGAPQALRPLARLLSIGTASPRMSPHESDRRYIERQIAYARPIIILLALIALFEHAPSHHSQRPLSFLI